MGMAAGQARLLSITTRMSDNELRAQLINNDKMRLATKSAQVSEAYTTALNDAQMMFTNYDADNKTSYQELTYNSLTAYNPYNNQYAISNSSGQVLVSEKDATNFKNANGDLNTFLESYGLKYSTDYFSSLINTNIKTADIDITGSDGKVLVPKGTSYLQYKTNYVDDKGDFVKGYIQMADAFAGEVGGANLAEVLQNLYNGVDKIHPGYDTTKSSKDYLDYAGYLSNYTSAKDKMFEVINDKMQNQLVSATGSYSAVYKEGDTLSSAGNFSFSQIETGLMNIEDATTMNDVQKYLAALGNIIGSESPATGLYTYATEKGKTSLTALKQLLDNNKEDTIKTSWNPKNATMTAKASLIGDITLNYTDADGYNAEFKKSGGNYSMVFKYGDQEKDTLTVSGVKEGTPANIKFTYYVNDEGDYSETPAEGYTACTTTVPESLFDKPSSVGVGSANWTLSNTEISSITDSEPNTKANMKTIGLQIIKTLQNSITNIWNIAQSDGKNGAYSKFTDVNSGETGTFGVFKDMALKFYNSMFGAKETKLPEDAKNILFNMDNIEDLRKAIETSATKDKQDSFKKIYDVYILDCVMNTYGEPKFTWIDQNNKNQNGEAKAQWYTNLFNRMKTGGYKTLQDGLASSTEWIKFAFESGLVTLEQVDGSNTWNSTTYSNCSDITEQTNNTAITIAEAEYTAQMNKIQNKDKMYDLELKNIDTEHNSLQTEYESIKGAIDKNIERTFKIYS